MRHVCAGTTAAHLLKGGSERTWPAPVPRSAPRRSISVGTVSEGPLQVEKSAGPAAKIIPSP